MKNLVDLAEQQEGQTKSDHHNFGHSSPGSRDGTGGLFDTVLIDEAAQAVECSTLIPLKYNAPRLVLVGDPKQLPATVLSNEAQKLQYGRSLFERLQVNAIQSVHH